MQGSKYKGRESHSYNHRQPRSKFTDLSFAAPKEKITYFLPTTKNSALVAAVKTEYGPASMLQNPQVGKLENDPVPPRIGNC